MPPIRTLIMGAAGRDFHDFNVFYRANRAYVVVAFTAQAAPAVRSQDDEVAISFFGGPQDFFGRLALAQQVVGQRPLFGGPQAQEFIHRVLEALLGGEKRLLHLKNRCGRHQDMEDKELGPRLPGQRTRHLKRSQ